MITRIKNFFTIKALLSVITGLRKYFKKRMTKKKIERSIDSTYTQASAAKSNFTEHRDSYCKQNNNYNPDKEESTIIHDSSYIDIIDNKQDILVSDSQQIKDKQISISGSSHQVSLFDILQDEEIEIDIPDENSEDENIKTQPAEPKGKNEEAPTEDQQGGKKIRKLLEQATNNKHPAKMPFANRPKEVLPEYQPEDIDEFIAELEKDHFARYGDLPISAMEELFLCALQRYEFIGELPITEETFRRFIYYLRAKAINNKIKYNPKYTMPAIFMISMVFCTIYAGDVTRVFWEPYARQVWNTEPSPYFQMVCRELFRYSREYLQRTINMSFNIVTEGDVVRPVYQHAIFPSHLQKYLAEWILNNFEQLLNYPLNILAPLLEADKSLDYVNKSLRDFVRGDDTRETAASLVSRMVNAIKFFHETEQAEVVEQLFISRMEKSLWVLLHQGLTINPEVQEKLRKFSPQITWFWDLAESNLYINLSHLRSKAEHRPDLVVWSENEQEIKFDDDNSLAVYPLRTKSGFWSLESIAISARQSLSGRIVVLSENYDLNEPKGGQENDILFDLIVPALESPLLFFRLDSRKSVARHKSTLDMDGIWLIAATSRIEIKNKDNEPIEGDDQFIPINLQKLGFRQAGLYTIKLPIHITVDDYRRCFEKADTTLIVSDVSLRGSTKIPNLSPEVPQIFSSTAVFLNFTLNMNINYYNKLSLFIYYNGQPYLSIPVIEMMRNGKLIYDETSCYTIDLSKYIPYPGSYGVDLMLGMASLLDEQLRFAWLPDEIEIEGPEETMCFSPAQHLTVTLVNVPADLIEGNYDDENKINQTEHGCSITWSIFKNSKCRFNILWKNYPIHLCWTINRVSGWIEGNGDNSQIYEGDEQDISLHVRAKPREQYAYVISESEQRREEYLKASGEYDAKLSETVLFDMLSDIKHARSTISIEMRGLIWPLFHYLKKVNVVLDNVQYNNSYISYSIIDNSQFFGPYTWQVRQSIEQRKIILQNTEYCLTKNGVFDIALEPGIYWLELVLFEESLCASQQFEVVVEPEQNIVNIQKIIEESKDLAFRALTARAKYEMSSDVNLQHIQNILQHLAFINNRENWLNKNPYEEGFVCLLPAWVVTQHSFLFFTERPRIRLTAVPERVIYQGIAGRGYIDIESEDKNKKIRVAAFWKPEDRVNLSRLWLGVPQGERIIEYSDINQLDMWPAYQCNICGHILASREGTYLKLPPSLIQRHRHRNYTGPRDRFIDTVYDKKNKIEIRISLKEDNLNNISNSENITVPNLLQDLLDKKALSSKQGDGIKTPLDFDAPSDYRIAVYDLYHNLSHPALINFKEAIKYLENIYAYLLKNINPLPAFSAMLRLLESIKEKTLPSRLPRYILILSYITRMKIHAPLNYSDIRMEFALSEDELAFQLNNVLKACPKMLEWAMAWIELFYIHAIS